MQQFKVSDVEKLKKFVSPSEKKSFCNCDSLFHISMKLLFLITSEKKNYSLTFPARKVADGGFPLSVVHFSVHSICLTFSFFLLSFIDVVIVVFSSPFVLLLVFLCLFNLSSHSFQSMANLLLLGLDAVVPIATVDLFFLFFYVFM